MPSQELQPPDDVEFANARVLPELPQSLQHAPSLMALNGRIPVEICAAIKAGRVPQEVAAALVAPPKAQAAVTSPIKIQPHDAARDANVSRQSDSKQVKQSELDL